MNDSSRKRERERERKKEMIERETVQDKIQNFKNRFGKLYSSRERELGERERPLNSKFKILIFFWKIVFE